LIAKSERRIVKIKKDLQRHDEVAEEGELLLEKLMQRRRDVYEHNKPILREIELLKGELHRGQKEREKERKSRSDNFVLAILDGLTSKDRKDRDEYEKSRLPKKAKIDQLWTQMKADPTFDPEKGFDHDEKEPDRNEIQKDNELNLFIVDASADQSWSLCKHRSESAAPFAGRNVQRS
jgi:hypothetical protein